MKTGENNEIKEATIVYMKRIARTVPRSYTPSAP
jgi:hypothetical protein